MAIKSSDQISIIDVTDAYSVDLTLGSYMFPGSISAALAGSITTQVIARCGAEQVAAGVVLSEVNAPSGVTVTKDTNAVEPTLTISVNASVTKAGVVKIPVHIGEITINKEFSFAIAFKGNTGATGDTGAAGKGITGVTNHYLASASSSGVTASTSGWTTTMQTTDTTKKYLWCYQTITYTSGDPTNTIPVIIGTHGATGSQGSAGVSITGVVDHYLATSASSGVTISTTGWKTPPADTIPSTTTANKYLWHYQTISYSSGNPTNTTPAIIGTHGETGNTGPAGADAITMSVTSSNGTIFKNSSIETTLTAHVYKAGAEVTGNDLSKLGTIKWYKDGGTAAVATGQTLTVNAGDVKNKASYTAQLEG